MMRDVAVPRQYIYDLLDRGFDILEAHAPKEGEDRSPGKDHDMHLALAYLDIIACAFRPAIDHIFHRELDPEGDADLHKWEEAPFPFPADTPEHVAVYREGIARVLLLVPEILPQGAATTLAFSLLAANQGDVPLMLKPSPTNKRGETPFQRSIFGMHMAWQVHYRAGRAGESLTKAREHYAQLLDLDRRSVERWDEGERVTPKALAEARRLGEAHRDEQPMDQDITKGWKPFSDDVFAKAYRWLIPNRRKPAR